MPPIPADLQGRIITHFDELVAQGKIYYAPPGERESDVVGDEEEGGFQVM